MNNIQDSFSIQDLEILTGIKAHTIRIWEKRFDLLNPTRLNRNIRVYSLNDLQKILNVSLLYNHNYKISQLSKFTNQELAEEAKKVSAGEFSQNFHLNSLIMGMYALDESSFEAIYQKQIKNTSFQRIFVETYLPLLNHIGVLWQTEAIKPAHEHFISNLIYQKIALNTAEIKKPVTEKSKVHVLFLPEGEIHEMGLLFLRYYLKLQGKKTIYLGRSIPFEDLIHINSQFDKIIWVAASVVSQPEAEKDRFLVQLKSLLKGTKNQSWVIGRIWAAHKDRNTNGQITFYEGFEDLISS